jgi:large subunit ribosomal protein L22
MADSENKTVNAAPNKAAAPEVVKPAEKPVAKADAKPSEQPVAKAEGKPEAKKAEPKKEEKPVVTEAHAFVRDIRVTPRKIRLVVDLVRGKNVDDALALLTRVNRAASAPVAKAIKSAAANATNNFGMDKAGLYIAEIQAADGIRMKRFEPRGKGSSSPLVKRTCNLNLTIKERK